MSQSVNLNHNPTDADFEKPYDGDRATNLVTGVEWLRTRGAWQELAAGAAPAAPTAFEVTFVVVDPNSGQWVQTLPVLGTDVRALTITCPPMTMAAGGFEIIVEAPTFSAGTLSATATWVVTSGDGTTFIRSTKTGALTSGEVGQFAPGFASDAHAGTDLSIASNTITSAAGGLYSVVFTVTLTSTGLTA